MAPGPTYLLCNLDKSFTFFVPHSPHVYYGKSHNNGKEIVRIKSDIRLSPMKWPPVGYF